MDDQNQFVAQFVQKYLEMRENEQNVVLNMSSEVLENCSEIVRILVFFMTIAGDGASGNNFVQVVARFFYIWCRFSIS